jgi:hypothetical protein
MFSGRRGENKGSNALYVGVYHKYAKRLFIRILKNNVEIPSSKIREVAKGDVLKNI